MLLRYLSQSNKPVLVLSDFLDVVFGKDAVIIPVTERRVNESEFLPTENRVFCDADHGGGVRVLKVAFGKALFRHIRNSCGSL
jgi:hypothetical protein